jgi:hypothetical protein
MNDEKRLPIVEEAATKSDGLTWSELLQIQERSIQELKQKDPLDAYGRLIRQDIVAELQLDRYMQALILKVDDLGLANLNKDELDEIQRNIIFTLRRYIQSQSSVCW